MHYDGPADPQRQHVILELRKDANVSWKDALQAMCRIETSYVLQVPDSEDPDAELFAFKFRAQAPNLQ